MQSPKAFCLVIGSAVVLAACVAALAAHLGIDLLADIVLTHDPYDSIGHPSRGLVVDGAVVLALGAAARCLSLAFADARQGTTEGGLALKRMLKRVGPRFALAVVGLSFALLLGMEGLDTLFDQGRIGDLDDLLGGSVVLALLVTVPSALLAALGVLRTLAFVAAAHDELVGAFGAFLRLVSAPSGAPAASAGARIRPRFRLQSRIARRNGKRGPPPLPA